MHEGLQFEALGFTKISLIKRKLCPQIKNKTFEEAAQKTGKTPLHTHKQILIAIKGHKQRSKKLKTLWTKHNSNKREKKTTTS